MKDVVKLINFIKSKALKLGEFKNFLSRINVELDDVIYFADLCWLSRRKFLKRVYDLKKDIFEFSTNKEKKLNYLMILNGQMILPILQITHCIRMS